MTLTDVVDKAIHGWMIDKRISIPAILAIISAAITAALFVSDIRADVRTNAREQAFLKQEIEDQKTFTRSIPMISERVGRLEATVAASVSRQENALDEIKNLIVQGR